MDFSRKERGCKVQVKKQMVQDMERGVDRNQGPGSEDRRAPAHTGLTVMNKKV